jgi:CheY-like chemotaxis protein
MRILILEDSPADVDLILDALRDLQPFKHQVVRNESEYLAALKESWDVILSDYNLPSFNALSALNILAYQGLLNKAPFIVVTGVLGPAAAQTCRNLGAADLIAKNSLGRLAEVVRGALR